MESFGEHPSIPHTEEGIDQGAIIAALRKQLDSARRKIEEQAIQISDYVSENDDLKRQLSLRGSKASLDLTPPLKDHVTLLHRQVENVKIESRHVREWTANNIYSSETVKGFANDDIKRLVDKGVGETYKRLQKELADVKLKIDLFKCNNDLGPADLLEMDHELKLISECRESLTLTCRNLCFEAKERNIYYGRDQKIDLIDPRFKFNGTIDPCTVYQFLSQMKDWFTSNHISPNEFGKYLRNFCKGTARKIIEDNFQLQASPDGKLVKGLLIKCFGDEHKILKLVIEEHRKVGQVSIIENGIQPCYTVLQRHVELIEKIEGLNIPCKEGYIHELYLCLSNVDKGIFDATANWQDNDENFNKMVINFKSMRDRAGKELAWSLTKEAEPSLTPSDEGKDDGSYNPGDVCLPQPETKSNWQEELSKITSNLNIPCYLAKNASTSVEGECSNIDQGSSAKYKVNHLSDNSCPLCRHIWKVCRVQPKDRMHVTLSHKPNIVFIETCSFIRDLSITMQARFLDKVKFCQICLLVPTKRHTDKNQVCNFTKTHLGLKCKICPLRHTTCSDPNHYKANKARLQALQRIYEEVGMHINVNI